jgi:hypothetical protein
MNADEFNIKECTIHQTVIQDLSTRKVRAKMAPKSLKDEQNACQTEVPAGMPEWLEIRNRVIGHDERWFF